MIESNIEKDSKSQIAPPIEALQEVKLLFLMSKNDSLE